MSDLRSIERTSIRDFVQGAAEGGYLSGRVLDYGCGKQPYRDVVEVVGGVYNGFDRMSFPANVSGEDVGDFDFDAPLDEDWDAILCNQVVQYVPFFFRDDDGEGLPSLLAQFARSLRGGGHLVMTYPTTWPEVEPQDLHRFTKTGMEWLLAEAGFEIVRHEPRAWFDPWGGFIIPIPFGTPEAALAHRHPPDALPFGYGVIARA